MKNTLKFLGIIAFIAIIGFGMISCASGNKAVVETEVETTEAGEGTDWSALPVIEWPSDEELAQFGLAGLQQPPETSDIVGLSEEGTFILAILNTDLDAFDNLADQIKALDNIIVSGEETDEEGTAIVFMNSETMNIIQLIFISADSVVAIMAN